MWSDILDKWDAGIWTKNIFKIWSVLLRHKIDYELFAKHTEKIFSQIEIKNEYNWITA